MKILLNLHKYQKYPAPSYLMNLDDIYKFMYKKIFKLLFAMTFFIIWRTVI